MASQAARVSGAAAQKVSEALSELREPQTVAALVAAWADSIASLLAGLAVGNLEDRRHDDRDSPFLIIYTSPYRWSPLSSSQVQLQSRAVEEYRRFIELLRVLLHQQPDNALRQLTDAQAQIVEFIERHDTAFSTPVTAHQKAQDALAKQTQLIENLFSDNSEGTLFVPDTNALYWNTALDAWRSPWPGEFSIVLTPAVLSEVDRHKNDDRNKSRQEKAERIDRQIGEYRRRGRLIDGVPLSRNVSAIRSIATEPRMSDSLPWLDQSSSDDRLVASAIEVMRRNVRSGIVVVTRDLNLQNKLEYARVPFLPPSDLVSKA